MISLASLRWPVFSRWPASTALWLSIAAGGHDLRAGTGSGGEPSPLAAAQQASETGSRAPRPDVVVADFEGPDYGEWQAAGEAFGATPARGTLPNQMPVSGFEGQGLVNSFHRGDRTTGTLTSPPFAISRRYLNFLIGGGGHARETCLNLLVDGQVVRTATGPNTQPGGSERLEWQSWDLTGFQERQATLQIVDQHTGGWGHINVDQIILSDRKRQAEPAHRDLPITHRYLHLPVQTGAPKRRVRLQVGALTVREFDIELPTKTAEFFVFTDVSPWLGQTMRIAVDALPPEAEPLALARLADEALAATDLYRETFRPQFHFTSRRGWLNDPNGLVFHRSEWHLFYQHNPYGWGWGNMHWGHALSTNLVDWREAGEALYPARYGDWAFSGSAWVDHANTAGFQTGPHPPLVAAFTSTGRGECIVFSNDRGRTWQEYPNNPVVRHAGRDPKVLWHAPSQRWIMAVYNETGANRNITFHSSPNLKEWQRESHIDGFFECPDLFPLPAPEQPGQQEWVLYAADGRYILGHFDGKAFHKTSGKHQLWYGNFYAAQTYSDAPNDRRVQIGWAQGAEFPGMPFNQQMTLPCDLSLHPTPEGIRMFARPVPELTALRRDTNAWPPFVLGSAQNPLASVDADLLELRLVCRVPPGAHATLHARGTPITYHRDQQQLTCGSLTAPLPPLQDTIDLHLFVDRGSIEVFANQGSLAISFAVRHPPTNRSWNLSSAGGATQVQRLQTHTLRSIWP